MIGNREGENSYIRQAKKDQGIENAYRQIDIVLSGDIVSNIGPTQGEPEDLKNSLPLFMRDLSPEDRRFSFLINPSQMETNYQKIINYFFTRGGWILEHVSDELPTMTLSGTTAAFKNPDLIDKLRLPLAHDEKDVLTTENRWLSIGYRNLTHLIDLYRNNGRIFYNDPFFGNYQSVIKTSFDYVQRIKTATPVKIIYGKEEMYEGFFTSMSTKESANKPYNIEFSLNFSITRIYELWRSAKNGR
jgi:hypothetical protein